MGAFREIGASNHAAHENEVWRDVVGYEGLYKISDKGRVMTLNYKRTHEARVLKNKKDGHGYPQVTLYKNGTPKDMRVHRLVAFAFLPNPYEYTDINHKDENPKNNNVENLEWCTRKYNLNYGGHNERMALSKKGKKWSDKQREKMKHFVVRGVDHPKSRPIAQIKDGVIIATFPCIADAVKKYETRNIYKCCAFHREFKGTYFEYID